MSVSDRPDGGEPMPPPPSWRPAPPPPDPIGPEAPSSRTADPGPDESGGAEPTASHQFDPAASAQPIAPSGGQPEATPNPVAPNDHGPAAPPSDGQPEATPNPVAPDDHGPAAPPSGGEPQAARDLSAVAPAADRPPLELGPDGRATIDVLLTHLAAVKASDLHVKAGSTPTIRMSGNLEPLDYHVLDAEEAGEMASALLGDAERATLDARGEVDFAYSLTGRGRFRINVHRQRGTLAIAARRIVPGAPNLNELDLPPAIEKLASEHRGLLLVTGPTSSGKTTTCGAVVKHINQTRRCHIVTIEDPIEILHEDAMSIVTQREVGQDTADFHAALRAAMRQDPDVIFVGEIRDTETVQTALQAAETGHFVLATLHTTNVAETITRIIDFFPPDQQKQVRVALAGSLVGVVTQRLIPRIGGGRAPAIEIMISNGRIRDCILDPEKTHAIHDIVGQSGFYGMQTFDQALVALYQAGAVTLEDASSAANSPHDFELMLQKSGLLAV